MTYEPLLYLLNNPVFQTIIGGLVLFIASQYILEFILKPRVELKKAMALLSEKILTYQTGIANGTLSIDQIKEIKDSSAKLLSLAWLVYHRDLKKRQYVDISLNVNGLVIGSQTKLQRDIDSSIQNLINLKKYKFLKVTFQYNK